MLAWSLVLVASGCRAPQAGPGLNRQSASSQPAPVVLYPGHSAPGRIAALRPISGAIFAKTKPPGALLRAITGLTAEPSAESEFRRPLSLAVRGGKMLICDAGRRALVQVDPRTGGLQLVALQGLVGDLDPVAVAVDASGDAYVADAAGRRVLRIDPGDAVTRTYSLPPDRPFVPIDLAVSTDRLYAVNRAARRVEVFDLEGGTPLGPFGDESQAPAAFPVAVAVDAEGHVYIVDMVSSRVRVHDPAGRIIRQIGGPGNRPGLFAQPRSVTVGPDGITYVVDVATSVVQMFDASGVLLMYFGGADGTVGRLDMPAKILTDQAMLEIFAGQVPKGFTPRYMIFVADQVGPGRIGVYAYGQMVEAGGAAQP
jgi:streptogramin lyase